MRRRILIALVRCGIVILLAATLALPVQAVVISTSSDTPNVQTPGNDPGWLNVGRVSGGSAVYLGNRWVITANHVDPGSLRLSDGRIFAESIGSNVRLSNAGVGVGTPDLRMFRLAADPGLPALSLATTMPALGSQVMMIGAGTNRSSQATGWDITSTATGLNWTPTAIQNADILGFSLTDSATMRWGLNLVSSGPTAPTFLNPTATFGTLFDQQGISFEAQATPGDSGGGVFHNSGDWQLAGLMIGTQPLKDQPSDTVVYGDGTSIANLAAYRTQIESFLNRAEPLWQNQVNHYDVNGNGRVSAQDMMLIVNQLLRESASDLIGGPGAGDWWLDVNGDYRSTTTDLMSVVNEILRERQKATALVASPLFAGDAQPFSATYVVPEPASLTLALAAAALLIGRTLRRRFRAQKTGTQLV